MTITNLEEKGNVELSAENTKGTSLFAQKKLKKITPPVKPAPPPVTPRPIFSRIDWGDVEMSPAVLTIRYGQDVIRLNQGGNGFIQISEGSPLIDSQGKVSVTVEYTLRNKTTKNFKFKVLLRYGSDWIAGPEVTLFSNRTKNIRQTVKLQPYNEYKYIGIIGPVGISDDTHIVFLNARLFVRVSAV